MLDATATGGADLTTWYPGSDPEQHPLWERQVNLERHMLRAGADRFRAQVGEAKRKARERGAMANLPSHRNLLREWVPLMAEGIKDFIRDARAQRRTLGGAIPVSLPYLEAADRHLAAYITLRHVLNTLASGRTGLMGVARSIGLALEQEARMQAWEKREPALYHEVRKGLNKQGATALHRRRVNINRFNKLIREKLDWQDWPVTDQLRIGVDLIDILVRYTKQFDIGPDPEHTFRAGSKTFRHPQYVLAARPELLEWLAKAEDLGEVTNPVYLPTLMPPARWEGTRQGAYYTPYVRPPHLVRFRAHQEEQGHGARDEYDALDMPVVYDALHAIQEVGWRVNQRVLDVAREVWKGDAAVAGLPRREPEPLPPTAPEDADEEVQKKARKERHVVRSRNAKLISSVLAVRRTMDIAEKFAGDTFYFPHMLDFRGRMYPIPVDFQPQGRDLARGLLTFAEGRAIEDEEAHVWLSIHLANMYGIDKVSFADRIDWAWSRKELWERIEADPLGEIAEWGGTPDKKMDYPWQALAAVIEWVEATRHGPGYVSHLPCRVDGTCNGIQHLSAMTRDAEGGASVNLMPAEVPQDIYAEVAKTLTEKLTALRRKGPKESRAMACWWTDNVARGEPLPRSFTKRPVMILPYGGTREAYFRYTIDWLEEHEKALVAATDRSELGALVGFVSRLMWDAVSTRVSGAARVMEWIKACAKEAAKAGRPVYWMTPSGFTVRHFYGKLKKHEIRTRVDGQSFRIIDWRPTRTLDVREQLKGISPNFVHSLDASALMTTLTMLRSEGVSSVTAVHDALGALAGDMWTLHHTLREAFRRTHEGDVLDGFREGCRDVLARHLEYVEKMDPDVAWDTADAMLPPPLPKGDLDIAAVLESDYFFA